MNNITTCKLRLEQTATGPAAIGMGGHIDLAAGTFDRPGPNPEKDVMPILPKEMTAVQLATERPPIEDADYIPNSVHELATAAAEVAKLIPAEQVKSFYLRLKELADENIERQEITITDEKDMIESKEKIVRMIREAIDDADDFDIPGIATGRQVVPYGDIIAAIPEEFADVKSHRRYAAALEADLVGRRKLMAMIEQLPTEFLDKLHNVAKDEYIDLFEEIMGADTDAADVDDLKSLSSDALYDMSDSYKFFFKGAFVLPALDALQKSQKAATRGALQDVRSKLHSLGVPQSAQSTAAFQMLGFSKRKPEEIKQRYINAGKTGELRPLDVESAYKRLMSKYADIAAHAKKDMLEKHAQSMQSFVDNSLSLYSKMSLEQRKGIMKQAFAKMS